MLLLTAEDEEESVAGALGAAAWRVAERGEREEEGGGLTGVGEVRAKGGTWERDAMATQQVSRGKRRWGRVEDIAQILMSDTAIESCCGEKKKHIETTLYTTST
ncbi:hypothetical protein OsI_18392 [Oryza sativa Indica Group]|jgi:hypothetical protein|uniref:Uncharacterized protein n=1 Tax=Oryza sativa subsp. indica TaxID=39946 RepID=B8AXV9_ORYSI|nr:hypothetical protein OsI_18392 [Oryza sativa Indica Group]